MEGWGTRLSHEVIVWYPLMDGAMPKAPLGGKKVGKHSTDRGKIGNHTPRPHRRPWHADWSGRGRRALASLQADARDHKLSEGANVAVWHPYVKPTKSCKGTKAMKAVLLMNHGGPEMLRDGDAPDPTGAG